jgi:hypothetical protein
MLPPGATLGATTVLVLLSNPDYFFTKSSDSGQLPVSLLPLNAEASCRASAE